MFELGKRIFVFPAFQNVQIACDVLNRISWGLFGLRNEDVTIFLPEDSFKNRIIEIEHLNGSFLSPSQESYLSELPPLAMISTNRIFESGDFDIFWNVSIYQKKRNNFAEQSTILIDPSFCFNYEADQIAALQYSIASEEKRMEFRNLSQTNYSRFLERWSKVENACLYLTGPSVEILSQKQMDHSAIKIICNSLVKNEKFLSKLQPDVLIFSDPAYHFGVSKYAAVFRSYVKQVMIEYPEMICIVPERFFPLTIAFLGDIARERIIGMPIIDSDQFNFPTTSRFFVKKTNNILTLMLIPIASQIAKQIFIFGADGRVKGDKGYWKHAQSSQMSDQMKTIYDSHPSLARDEDVEKYYEEHCQLLEELLQYGEKSHEIHYCCKTPSFIPALAKRVCCI
jgi:hypothetical protein